VVRLLLPASETESAGHGAQAAGLTSVLKLPATHAVHAPPFVPEYPMLQRQAVLTALLSGDCADGGHATQPALPEQALNVSAAHAVHSPPMGPE